VPLASAAAKQQMLRLLNALRCCHGRGVVHGDVKPANAFINRYGHAQLGDFGVRDFLPDGRRGHTLEYAAPELLSGRPRSAASDVWAAMVTAYELFCGDMPFGSAADDPEDVVAARIVSGRFPKVAVHRPLLPRALQRMFEAAFVVDPAARDLSSAELAINALADVPLQADWVNVRRPGVAECWEGLERDPNGEPTGVALEAVLTHLPRAKRFEADVRRRRPGSRFQRIAGTRVCADVS
jgi:serine/threonine protein kinase